LTLAFCFGILSAAELLPVKDKYVGVNLMWLAAPGGGLGIEAAKRVGSGYGNVAMFGRLTVCSAPGDTEGNPLVVRVNAGLAHFPSLQLYRGFFVSDMMTATVMSYTYPNPTSTGTLFELGPVWEIGYRWVVQDKIAVQTSFGLGFLYQGLLSVPANQYAPQIREHYQQNWWLNADGGLEIGLVF
jgi:hypothetical protein